MTIRIDGTNTAANPGITGTDTDTGLQFGTDEVNIVTGGSTRATVDSSGVLNVSSGDLRVTGTEGISASLYLIADQGDDNGDGWRINSNQDDNDLTISTNTTGSYVDQVGILTSGDFRFNSGYGSVATAYGCRAWVNFDGKAASIGSGRANGNVSSVADNGTGQYTVNFSNSFPDSKYAATQFCRADSGGGLRVCVGRGSTGFATSSIQVEVRNGSNSNEDVEEVCLAFFR